MERDVRAGGVTILRQDDLREQQMVRAESRIDGREYGERADEEAGANNQEGGKGNLKSDDGLPDEGTAFYAIGDLCAHGRQRWREAEEHASGNRNQRGKTEHRPVEVRGKRRDGATSNVGERQSAGAANR